MTFITVRVAGHVIVQRAGDGWSAESPNAETMPGIAKVITANTTVVIVRCLVTPDSGAKEAE